MICSLCHGEDDTHSGIKRTVRGRKESSVKKKRGKEKAGIEIEKDKRKGKGKGVKSRVTLGKLSK